MLFKSTSSAFVISWLRLGLPWRLRGKEPKCHNNTRDAGSISGSGRSPGEGNGPLQYSCLGNSHGLKSLAGYSRGACIHTHTHTHTHTVAKSQTWLQTHTRTDVSVDACVISKGESPYLSSNYQRSPQLQKIKNTGVRCILWLCLEACFSFPILTGFLFQLH